jgi:MoxR-like ATPase
MTQKTDPTNGNAATDATSWFIFRAENTERADAKLPAPPPWRRFNQPGTAEAATDYDVPKAIARAPFLLGKPELDVINTALHLRRPLLVTGKPGAGKSTLAHALAHELVLGQVLVWPINTRSTLGEGLYRYDAVARLQAANLDKNQAGEGSTIGRFLRLGPLGTALAREQRARVLLIDEIDKSDVDFPNDLLHVLETGEFEIPELSRSSQDDHPHVRVHDLEQEVSTDKGWIRCREFPLIVMTSNGEREFPPAFLRRCVRLQLNTPSDTELAKIVMGHLKKETLPAGFQDQVLALAKTFLERAQQNDLATDQLMNAAYLLLQKVPLDDELKKHVFRPLSGNEAV